jgi:hypothetical protein
MPLPGLLYAQVVKQYRRRRLLPYPEPTHGTGSAKRWQPRTPAMDAKLTNHVWTLREVLLFRVPKWPQFARR